MPAQSVLGLKAKLGVETDDRQVEREVDSLKDKIAGAAEAEMEADVDALATDLKSKITDSLSEVPGGDLLFDSSDIERQFKDGTRDVMKQMDALGKGAGGPAMGRPSTPPSGQQRDGGLGGELLSGMKGAGGKFLNVGLKGAVGAGILAGISQLSDSAPRLNKTMSMMFRSIQLFARPFGDLLGRLIEPMAEELLDLAVHFNQYYAEDGLPVAVIRTAADAASDPGTSGTLLGMGGGAAGGARLGARFGMPGMLAGGALGAIGGGSIGARVGGFAEDNPLAALGGGMTAAGGALMHGGVRNRIAGAAGSFAARGGLTGPAGLGLAGIYEGGSSLTDIAQGGDGGWLGSIGESMGDSFEDMFPSAAEKIESAFTHDKNIFHSFGQWVREDIIDDWPGWSSILSNPLSGMSIDWDGWSNVITNPTEGVSVDWESWTSVITDPLSGVSVSWGGWGSLISDPLEGIFVSWGGWGSVISDPLSGINISWPGWSSVLSDLGLGDSDGSSSGSSGGIGWGHVDPTEDEGLSVPWLAEGGVVTSATQAVVGEGTEAEAVQPLSQLENMLEREWERGAQRGGSQGSSGGRSDLDDVADKLDEIASELHKLDPETELKVDRKTLAKEENKGRHRYGNSKVVTR